MINENKLKEFMQDILTWTGINDRPDVKKMLQKKLDEAINPSKKKVKRTTGEIMNNINELLGFKKYDERIKWSYGNKEEMLKLESAIKCVSGKNQVTWEK